MTAKNKIIERINNQFNLNIDIDYKIKTHQRKYRNDGGFSWYLNGDNIEFNKFGGCEPISKMIAHQGDFKVHSEGYFIELICD